MAHDLKIPVVNVVGHLHVLWHTILEQQEDGDLSEWPDGMVEEAALWEGMPGEFIASLRARGWLDGHLLHDWLDYTGLFLTKKYSSGNVQRLKDIWMKHGYKYGKGNGKYCKHKANTKRTESEHEENIPNQPNQPNQPEEKVKPLRASVVDDDFWSSIGANPAYRHIDLAIENGKMDAWLALPKNKHRNKTRQFVLNWLNKIDKPVSGAVPIRAPCQERVRRGNFLKSCGEPSVGAIGGRPLCQQHKEHHESRINSATT